MALGTLANGKPDRLFVPDKEDGWVYHWMNSQSGPQGDQNLFMAQWEGWEPAPMDPTKVPSFLLDMAQQGSSEGAGLVHRRGDLVLYRMRREQWEKTVHAETEANRTRMETSIDTMVMQAQANAAKALKERGQTRIPSNLVFREDVGDPSD